LDLRKGSSAGQGLRWEVDFEAYTECLILNIIKIVLNARNIGESSIDVLACHGLFAMIRRVVADIADVEQRRLWLKILRSSDIRVEANVEDEGWHGETRVKIKTLLEHGAQYSAQLVWDFKRREVTQAKLCPTGRRKGLE
jgi:hypothetical protein